MIPMDGNPGQKDRIAFTLRTPVGVVCAITPFNAPFNALLHKIAPAIAAGNAVILKPSGYTPLTASLICDVLLEAGWPGELLSLVHGEGAEAGNGCWTSKASTSTPSPAARGSAASSSRRPAAGARSSNWAASPAR